MKDFTHYNACSIDEAASLLKKRKGKAKVNAGGSDLLGLLKDRIVPDYPESIINLKDIEGLNYVREDDEGLNVGALATLSSVAASPLVKERYGLLAEAARAVATPQVRNMATIGGNLAQEVRCWYYRYPDELGGTVMCLRKGGAVCNALVGDNRYHSIFGTAPLTSYPCASACPADTAIPSYLGKIKEGDMALAARLFIDFNPMPAVTGRVCPTFCEPECKRSAYDEPVAVRCVERALGDYMLEHANLVYEVPETESGKRVAIIGSGPAGLAAAYYLRRKGHSVTVIEKLTEAGGMLRYAIPSYRLPGDVVKKQAASMEGMGIAFRFSTDVGKETLEYLKDRFDAVLVATGAWKEKTRQIKGNARTISGLEFLKRIKEGDRTIPGRKVAVVGGGNVAVDVARTLVRLGAKPVVIYRRTAKEMPAFKDEVEKAREEGVAFQFLTLPVRAEKKAEKISLTCIKMELGLADDSGRRSPVPKEGSEFSASFDSVIRAVGEEPDRSILPALSGKKESKGAPGHLVGGNIYRAGDFMNGSSTVIEAVASGREAARAIDAALQPVGVVGSKGLTSATPQPCFTPAAYEPLNRLTVEELPVAARLKDLGAEDKPGISATEAAMEAKRCFNCGCVAVNPSDIGVALVALDGKIVTTKRSIEASAFFAPDAARPTILDSDEIITEIRIPKPPEGARQQYLKFTLRKPIDFAIVSVATVIAAKNGTCADARIALGAVAPAPFRAIAAEGGLIGKPLTDETASMAAEAALNGAVPLHKNGYKVQIAKALVARAILGKSE